MTIPTSLRKKVDCWGHRGASAFLPENTLASFRAAIEEGAGGIESDLHTTTDGVILMFHDPTLDRTTDSSGVIKELAWAGHIENARTRKEPKQPIPRFDELVALIMEPANQHVVLNLDCKVQNDPEVLFPIIAKIISQYPSWETLLAPRLILGLWHPLFLSPALTHLPLLTRFHIGASPALARKYFWDACSGFSIAFPMLVPADGQVFLRECREAGKEVTVWTVNEREEMRAAMGWGVKAILTDKVGFCVGVIKEFEDHPEKLEMSFTERLSFEWLNWKYFTLAQNAILLAMGKRLTSNAYMPGPFEEVLSKQAKMVKA